MTGIVVFRKLYKVHLRQPSVAIPSSPLHIFTSQWLRSSPILGLDRNPQLLKMYKAVHDIFLLCTVQLHYPIPVSIACHRKSKAWVHRAYTCEHLVIFNMVSMHRQAPHLQVTVRNYKAKSKIYEQMTLNTIQTSPNTNEYLGIELQMR